MFPSNRFFKDGLADVIKTPPKSRTEINYPLPEMRIIMG